MGPGGGHSGGGTTVDGEAVDPVLGMAMAVSFETQKPPVLQALLFKPEACPHKAWHQNRHGRPVEFT